MVQKPFDFTIKLLGEEDIPAAMRLKGLARWNQTEDDWRRLLQLERRGCFAAVVGGEVVATTMTTTYGRDLAWVGMVLVDPEFRRKGIANRMMHTALDYLREVCVATIKLDATPESRPVYDGLGFEAELMIERWSGIASASPDSRASALDPLLIPELLELDRTAFGADRSRLLRELISEACVVPIISYSPGGRLNGYALARRGTTAVYTGPVIATDTVSATALLGGLLGQLAGSRVYIDVNTTFEGATQELAARGFVKQRDLIRMRYGEKTSAGTSQSVFAIAGPEIG